MVRKANYSAKPCDAGFTLIELLVAISLMAVVAVLGWRGLDSIANTRDKLDQSLTNTRGLQAAFTQLQLDASQILSAAQSGEQPTLWSDGRGLSLLRRVAHSEQPTRLLRVTYRIQNGELLRETESLAPGLVPDSPQPARQVRLAAGIESMTVKIWTNDSRGWRPAEWSPVTRGSRAQTQPRGLAIDITMRGQRRPVSRLLLVGAV